MKNLGLGIRTLMLKPGLILAAWLNHVGFAVLAGFFPFTQIMASLAHRPAASAALLRGLDAEMLVDWFATYGRPLTAYWNAAVFLAVGYGVATVLLEAVILPMWLRPFERRQSTGSALQRLIAPTLGGLVVWALLIGAAFQTPLLLVAAFLLRVVLNLWKCAAVSGAGGLDAVLVAFQRFGSVLLLSAATLGGTLVYAALAGLAGALTVISARVVPLVILQQALILAAIVLRLWLLAATVVLWRRARPELESA